MHTLRRMVNTKCCYFLVDGMRNAKLGRKRVKHKDFIYYFNKKIKTLNTVSIFLTKICGYYFSKVSITCKNYIAKTLVRLFV